MTATKERLLDAAVELFAERGYDATSVTQVINRAGATKGGFYHHFVSKEALLYEVYGDLIGRQLAALDEILARRLPPAATLRALIDDLVRTTAASAGPALVFWRELGRLDAVHIEQYRRARRRYHDAVRRLVREGQAGGDFADVAPADTVTFTIFGFVNELPLWYKPNGRKRPAQLAGELADLVLAALDPRKGWIMDVRDAVVVVTGAAGGIGAALVRRFAAEGARRVVAADLDGDGAQRVAQGVGDVVVPAALDVTDTAAMTTFVQGVLDRDGPIDLFCSNAGVLTGVELDDPTDLWHKAYDVNVMAHVYAARAVLPRRVDRGRGWLLNTASAAGLLTAPGDAVYTVTKHGAVAFAEWLSVTYGGRGIGVSVICPFGVATPMLLDALAAGEHGAQVVAASGEVLTPEQVADAVVTGLAQERFLILPHPEVGRFWAQKASDPDRWLAGVRRLIDNT